MVELTKPDEDLSESTLHLITQEVILIVVEFVQSEVYQIPLPAVIANPELPQ